MSAWDPNDTSAARARFSEIVSQADEQIDLAEAALWLAAEGCPRLDVGVYLERLDRLAEQIRPALPEAGSESDCVAALTGELSGVHGFHGSHDEYYDPRNSFLNEVLDRKTGIPISLCLVFIEVARRLGLDADGVNFPGHFLARVGDAPIVVDAFEGRIASRSECTMRLVAVLGPDAELTPEVLAPATKKQVLLRMLGNLKSIYAGQQDFEAALGCCDRSLLIAPDSPIELRDRGLMYHGLDCTHPAIADLERYLELEPEGEGADAIRRLVGQLHGQLPSIH
jgi:regulator of sirC expression with transglutaminase-like and TPR domain